jgi:multiple sugar transport system substrate-binding protein
MDDKKNTDQLQAPSEVPQPIYETVPVDPSQVENIAPEEVASNVTATDQTDFTQVQPEIAPLDAEPVVEHKEQSKLPIILGGIGVFVIVFIVLLVLLLGGKKKIPSAPQQVTLTYWGLWEEKEVMDPIIKEYEKKNPHVTITYEKKTEQDYRKKLLTWISTGKGPDIFRFHNTWLPEMMLPGTPAQLALSTLPEEVMTPEGFEKTFFPIHAKDLIRSTKDSNGKVIKKYVLGMPLMVDGLVMLVNEDLLKKAGISTIPTNWDEMIADASQVVVKGKDGELITAGFAAGTATNVAHYSDIFGLMLLLNGGSLFHLDQPEAAGALEAYRRFAEEPNNVWSELMPNSINAFAQGKVAMIIVPSWEIHTIKNTSPDLKFVVAPIPNPPGGDQFSLASYWVEGVSSKSKNQTEAWKFLAYLASKDVETKMFEAQSNIRMFGTPYSRVDLADLLISDPYLGTVIKQASEDKFKSQTLISNTFDDGLNDGVGRYLENAINSTSQGVSYNEAMKTAQEGVTQVLSQYNIVEK